MNDDSWPAPVARLESPAQESRVGQLVRLPFSGHLLSPGHELLSRTTRISRGPRVLPSKVTASLLGVCVSPCPLSFLTHSAQPLLCLLVASLFILQRLLSVFFGCDDVVFFEKKERRGSRMGSLSGRVVSEYSWARCLAALPSSSAVKTIRSGPSSRIDR